MIHSRDGDCLFLKLLKGEKMNNEDKMPPSILPKSTELTKTNRSSTELSKMPSSWEITQAKSNITSAKSNIAPAKSNIKRSNNGGGGGGGDDDGNGGPGGGDDGTTIEIFLSNSSSWSGTNFSSAQSYSQSSYGSSKSFCFNQSNVNDQPYASSRAYSHQQPSISTERNDRETADIIRNNHGSDIYDRKQYLRQSPEPYQEQDTKQQKELLSGLGIIILVIIALPLLFGIVNALFNLVAQISSSPLMLIVFLMAGLFLLKKYGRSLLSKDATGTKYLKVIQARALDYALSRFNALTLNARSSSECTIVRSKDQSK